MASTTRQFCHLDDDFQEELRGTLDIQARLLYGLIHARWIVTARGLAKMVRTMLYDQPYDQTSYIQISTLTHYLCIPLNPVSTAGQVQKSRFRPMPSRALPRPASSPSRPNGRPVREISQAVLWPLRGHLLAQILSPRLHRRCLFRHFLPAPTLPRLSHPPSPQERTCRPRPWGSRYRSGCRRYDRRRSASPWDTRARRARRRRRRPRRSNQHGYSRAARGSIPPAYLWLPGKRSSKVATLARSYAG